MKSQSFTSPSKRHGSALFLFAVGSHCKEGPAVSRTQMEIAWAVNQGFDLADIVYAATPIGRDAAADVLQRRPGLQVHAGVVSDDGRYLAFQLSKTTDETGYGYGMMVMDLGAYMAAQGITFPAGQQPRDVQGDSINGKR